MSRLSSLHLSRLRERSARQRRMRVPRTNVCPVDPSPSHRAGARWASLIWNGQRQGSSSSSAKFLGSTEDRFFVPTCRRTKAPRAAAVKAGRRPPPKAARSGLDRREHGARLAPVGTKGGVSASDVGGWQRRESAAISTKFRAWLGRSTALRPSHLIFGRTCVRYQDAVCSAASSHVGVGSISHIGV